MPGGVGDGATVQEHGNVWAVLPKPAILQGLEEKGAGGFRVADGKTLVSKVFLPALYNRVVGSRLDDVACLAHWANI